VSPRAASGRAIVPSVMAQALGDVFPSRQAECADGQVARGAVPVRTRGLSSAYEVSLTWWVCVLDAPVVADAAGGLGCLCLLRGQVGHPVGAFQGDLAGAPE
jgi:hypothetical protein